MTDEDFGLNPELTVAIEVYELTLAFVLTHKDSDTMLPAFSACVSELSAISTRFVEGVIEPVLDDTENQDARMLLVYAIIAFL